MKWYSKIIIALLIAAIAQNSHAQDRSNKGELAEENQLIVQIAVDNYETEENIEIYQHEGGYIVPLGFLAQFLDFAINTQTSNGQASGWFIKENQKFLLDTNKRTVVINGQEKTIGTRIMIVGSDDIYVDSSLFSEWFPVDLELNFSRLILKIKPREKLPFQEQQERKQRQNSISKGEKKESNFQKIDTAPQNFTIPLMDIDLGNEFNSKASPRNNASYSVLAQGDAAKFSTNVFLSGDSENNPNSARIRAGNKDNSANLLGGLKATEYSFGDIQTTSIPLIGGRNNGRGFYISNTDLTRPDQFDQTSFTGDSQPGWQVELYRNGELLGFQNITDNGRYEFKNVPVLYGNNSFKIISYGPQGQVKEEIKNYSIDDSILKKGTFNYSVSGDQKSQTLLGFDEKLSPLQTKKEGRFLGSVQYGLSDKITASTGFAQTPLEDLKTHNYQTFGINSSIGGLLSTINGAYDYENNGTAAQAVVNTSIKDVSVRLEHDQFHNFVSEENFATSDQRISTSKMDLNGMISKFVPSGVSYGLGVIDEKFENDRHVVTYSNRLSTTLYGIGIGNNFQNVVTKQNDDKTSLDTSEFSIRGNYRQTFVRLTTNYHISPEFDIRSVDLAVQKDLANKMNILADIRKDLDEDTEGLTTLNLSLTKEYNYYRLSALTSADTSDNYTVGVRLSFSAGADPSSSAWFASNRQIAGDGAISASAFLDNNYNSVFDNGDEPIEKAGFTVANQKYMPKDGAKSTLITNIDTNNPADVEVSLATIEDPFLVPTVKGYNVKTRPGVVTPIVFPLSYVTEIDGTVYTSVNNKKTALHRAIVELIDDKGKVVNTTKSEYDGFYVLTNVMPGTYQIRLARETLDKVGAVIAPQTEIKILPKSDFINGIDIIAMTENEPGTPGTPPVTKEKNTPSITSEEKSDGPILPGLKPSFLNE